MTAGLPLLAVVVVLVSALVHATWNVLLARVQSSDREREERAAASPAVAKQERLDFTAVGLAVGLVAWAPVALARWRVEPGAWPYALGSAVFEVAYFASLNLAYSRAPAHAVYPVARGLAPVLLLVPVAAVGLPVFTWVGVLAISAGVVVTAWGEVHRRAMVFAVPVALCIAGHTFLDAHGVRHADPATYLWLTICPVVPLLLAERLRRRGGVAALRVQLRPSTFVFGIGVFSAYGLTLAALSLVSTAQVPAVAALRETSILFVLALSWLAAARPSSDRQRPNWASAAGAVAVFGGVALLAFG